jgi:hypothetical protein
MGPDKKAVTAKTFTSIEVSMFLNPFVRRSFFGKQQPGQEMTPDLINTT